MLRFSSHGGFDHNHLPEVSGLRLLLPPSRVEIFQAFSSFSELFLRTKPSSPNTRARPGFSFLQILEQDQSFTSLLSQHLTKTGLSSFSQHSSRTNPSSSVSFFKPTSFTTATLDNDDCSRGIASSVDICSPAHGKVIFIISVPLLPFPSLPSLPSLLPRGIHVPYLQHLTLTLPQILRARRLGFRPTRYFRTPAIAEARVWNNGCVYQPIFQRG